MSPTIKVGETVRVDSKAYDNAEPQINDIIVFHPPSGVDEKPQCGQPPPPGQACAVPTPTNRDDLDFLYRVVALPGDRLRIEDGAPVVNGTKAVEDFIIDPCQPGGGCDFPVEFTVPSGHYYVLGDNRSQAPDSRYWGPVDRTAIEGKVVGL
jgi:signal peptidase I